MQNLSETFAFFCGTQHVKVKYNCQLKVEDLGSILNPKISEAQELALKAASDHTLYSNNLRGLIIFVRECDIPRYGSDQKINAAVFKRSSSTPELHFDSLSDQITSTLENNSDLKIGDFIITRHSNLYPFHIVFHLVCPNEFGTALLIIRGIRWAIKSGQRIPTNPKNLRNLSHQKLNHTNTIESKN